jgi:hypothetical protein
VCSYMNSGFRGSCCRVWSVFLLALLCAQSAWAKPAVPAFHRLPPAMETDVTPWAKPLPEGPLRVLLIAPRATLGDAAALAARLDVKFDCCAWWDRDHPGFDPAHPQAAWPGAAPEAVLARLDTLLDRPYDAVVLAGVDVRALPDALARKLVEKVAAGTGLLAVYIQPSETALQTPFAGLDGAPAASVVRGLGALGVPGESDDGSTLARIVRTGRHDTGRIAWLRYPGATPSTHVFLPGESRYAVPPKPFVENAYALVTRALLWAAKRDGAAFLLALQDKSPTLPDVEELPPDLPEEFVTTSLEPMMAQPLRLFQADLSQPAAAQYSVSVRVRALEDDVLSESALDVPWAKGARSYGLDVLIGPGRYWVDVWLRAKKGVVDWRTDLVTITAWPRFEDLRLAKEAVLPNDLLELRCTVPPVFNDRRTCTLYARAVDFIALPKGEGDSRASIYQSAQPYSGLHGRLVGETMAQVASSGGDVLLRLPLADLLAPMLRVEVFALEGPPRDIADWENTAAFHATRFVKVHRPPAAMRSRLVGVASALEEPQAQRSLERLRGLGLDTVYGPASEAQLANAGALGLWYIPEAAQLSSNSTIDGLYRVPCFSEARQAKATAKTLANLAARHHKGSTGRFGLGLHNRLSQSEENICQSPACLQGFQAWLEQQYGRISALNAHWSGGFTSWESVTPPDPEILLEIGEFAPWVDFRRYMNQVFSEYHRFVRAQLRAAAPNVESVVRVDAESGPYTGYDWSALAEAVDTIVLPPHPVRLAALRGRTRAALSFGLDFKPDTPEQARWLVNYAALNGASELWCMAPFPEAEEGKPWSALGGDGQPTAGFAALSETVRGLSSGLWTLLENAQRHPASIALYDSPASRLLNAIDPASDGSSEASETRFARFLEQRGHGLDVVGKRDAAAGRLKAYSAVLLPRCRALEDGEAAALRGYVAQGGVLIADVPPGTHDGHGKPRGTPALDGHARVLSAPWEPALETLLAEAGCRPAVVVEMKKNRAFLGPSALFSYGNARIHGLLAAKEQSFRPVFDKQAVVYDCIRREILPRPHKTSYHLETGALALFAQLPYRVASVQITAPEHVQAGQRLFVTAGVQSEEGLVGRHLLSIWLEDPAGNPMPHYRHILDAPRGAAKTFFPLARNERANTGTARYSVVARDLLSGVEGRVKVFVGGRIP